MSDEATVVGVAAGYWAAACSRCDWVYRGQCREVDSASRSHCRGCGGDVVAMTNPGKEVVLRLERDILGRVVAGSPTTTVSEDPELVELTDSAGTPLVAPLSSAWPPDYYNQSGLEDSVD